METPFRLSVLQRQFRGAKRHLLWVFVAFGVGASLTWWYRAWVFYWLLSPVRRSMGETWKPIFTGPTDMFGLTIHLAMLGGLAFASPVLLYAAVRFISPFLPRPAKRFVLFFLLTSIAAYLIGAAFALFVMLPTGLTFLLQFGTDIATPMIRITEYMDLALAMVFWLGVVFELPLAMLMATKMRIVPYETLKRLNRYVPVMAFILGAIITPTFDVVNQTLVSVPIILLYEVGLFLAWTARRRPRR